jgi:hypothetical protein
MYAKIENGIATELHYAATKPEGKGWTQVQESDPRVVAYQNSVWVREEEGEIVEVFPSPVLPEGHGYDLRNNTPATGWRRVARDDAAVLEFIRQQELAIAKHLKRNAIIREAAKSLVAAELAAVDSAKTLEELR